MVLIHHSSASPAPGFNLSDPTRDPDLPTDRHLAKQQRQEERRRAVEREMRREAEEDRSSVAREQLQNAEWIRSGGISFRMSPLPSFPELERAIEAQEYYSPPYEPIADDLCNAHPAVARGTQLVRNSRAPSSRQELESSIRITNDHRQGGRRPRHHAYRQEYLPGRAVHVKGTRRPQEYLHHIHHSMLKGPTPTPNLHSGPHHLDPRSTYGADRDQYGTLYGGQHDRSQLSTTSSHNRLSSRHPLSERRNSDLAHRRGGPQGYTFQPDSQPSNAFSIDRSNSRKSYLGHHGRRSPHHGGFFDGNQNFAFIRSDSHGSYRRRQDRESPHRSSGPGVATRQDASSAYGAFDSTQSGSLASYRRGHERRSPYANASLDRDQNNHRSTTSQRPSSGDLNTTLDRLHIGLLPTSQPSMAWSSDHPFPNAAPTQDDHSLQLAGSHRSHPHYAHVSLEPFDRCSNLYLTQQKAIDARQLRRGDDPHHPLTKLHHHGSYDQMYLNDFNRPRRVPAHMPENIHKSNRQGDAQGTGEYDGVWSMGSPLAQYDSRGSPIDLFQSELHSIMGRSRELDSRTLATTSRDDSDGHSDLGSGSTVTLDGDDAHSQTGSLRMADDYENISTEENARTRTEYTGRGRGNSWSEAKGRFGL